MRPAMPELGWAGTLGVTIVIILLGAALVLYHLWMDRRLKRERERAVGREDHQSAGSRTPARDRGTERALMD